jgi:hypothetical protein
MTDSFVVDRNLIFYFRAKDGSLSDWMLGAYNRPTRYRALESGAFFATLALLVSAVIANLTYPSSFWFLAGSATGGLLVFLSWRASVERSQTGAVIYAPLGAVFAALGLLAEIDRPLIVNIICGFSVFGAVMFGLIEAARRARGQAKNEA